MDQSPQVLWSSAYPQQQITAGEPVLVLAKPFAQKPAGAIAVDRTSNKPLGHDDAEPRKFHPVRLREQ